MHVSNGALNGAIVNEIKIRNANVDIKIDTNGVVTKLYGSYKSTNENHELTLYDEKESNPNPIEIVFPKINSKNSEKYIKNEIEKKINTILNKTSSKSKAKIWAQRAFVVWVTAMAIKFAAGFVSTYKHNYDEYNLAHPKERGSPIEKQKSK